MGIKIETKGKRRWLGLAAVLYGAGMYLLVVDDLHAHNAWAWLGSAALALLPPVVTIRIRRVTTPTIGYRRVVTVVPTKVLMPPRQAITGSRGIGRR